MVNIDDFVKRLESVLEYYGLNASAFADKIGVQRSSMSHLLSGRNKPSLDFVMKILEVFPDVDLYWILTGKGSFPRSNTEEADETQKYSSPILPNQNMGNDLFSAIEIKSEEEKRETRKSPVLNNENFNLEDEEIEKIVLFYKNGTFKAYSP
ncbi:helix-turn-helix domain-containing protein [Flavobacterium sharifuzzamanii]|uniref:helix-turn-helix domain-containing protein n=1 Tax=Flavobacterium sharifuzzamanii TaxID=2211133 RepID=UPI000DAD9895|nr:helix-turn-helix transcriptional regulator [Flavobacterium sharifuzzamanii]KAF2080936.1 helix-turn-helix transcriptional regulator [Flavobacterium sharifuzzamanii]